jgi:hypothetical protein
VNGVSLSKKSAISVGNTGVKSSQPGAILSSRSDRVLAQPAAPVGTVRGVGAGSGGDLWHIIRFAGGGWQASVGLIESQSSSAAPTLAPGANSYTQPLPRGDTP